jgi:peptidoglycan/LPS O-acetylase OafA/YrhL
MPTQTPSKVALHQLTSIRGIAAWWVIVYHFRNYCEPYLPDSVMKILDHGYLAVDMFFVLSGFVIFLNYANRFSDMNRNSYWDFLIRRLGRIYPLHLFILFAYISAPLAIFIFRPNSGVPGQFGVWDFFLNVLLIQNWGLTNHLSWNFPSWSISAEWAAYLIFPILAWLLNRLKGGWRAHLLSCIGPIVLLALIYHLSESTSIGQSITSLGTIRCILEFTSGAAMCNMFLHSKDTFEKPKEIYLALSIALIALFVFGLGRDYFFLPASIVLGLMYLVVADNVLIKVLNVKPLVFLGEISYSTYMIHALVIRWIKFVADNGTDPIHPVWIAIYFVVVFTGSVLLYKLVEIPSKILVIEKVRNFQNRRQIHSTTL